MPGRVQQYASSIASHRVLLYSIFSIGAVLGVIVRALKRHSNFYSVAVYISKSNGTVMVMANFGVLLALLAGKFVQIVFFGPLRPMEVERLYDRMWFFVTESLLAFTIFRDEFDIPFALMFGILLFTKCFHWLLSDRIEWMDQRPYPGPPLLFHIRTHALISLLWVTDLVAFLLTIENMLSNGVGGTVLFASEYAILLASLGNSVAKYCLALAELRRASLRGGENAPPWEDKSMLVFYVELATDFLKLVTYLTFFMLVLTFYGLPFNIVRDVYITARSFIMRFRDLIRYRTATRNMDQRYPNATEEELGHLSDRTCIICRDEMIHSTVPDTAAQQRNEQQAPQDGPNTTPKKLPCGHIFHFHCLRSWLERQQSCPTCRRSVLENERPTQQNDRADAARPRPVQIQQVPVAPAQQLAFDHRPENQNYPIGGQGPAQALDEMGMLWGAPRRYQEIQRLPPFGYIPRVDRFQGFIAPDGVWHPWPQGPHDAVVNEPQHAAVHTPTQIPTANTTNSDPASNSNGQNNISDGREDTRNDPSASSPTTSAREAAAAAALRRLSPSAVGTDRTETLSTTGTLGNVSSPTMTRTGPQDNTATPSPQPPNPDLPSHAVAPPLIPLYDPRDTPRIWSRPNTARARRRQSPSALAPSVSEERPLQELPPTLTDDQLNVLDRLTREAIDERLRILESIQEATSRCATELLRCRSVLPRSTPPSDLSTGRGDNNAGLSSTGVSSTNEGGPVLPEPEPQIQPPETPA